MANSPDIKDYVDLTLDDRDPQDLLDQALANLATLLPDVVLREGHTEAALLEQLSLMCCEIIFAINRVPEGIADVVVGMFGISRDFGLAPTAHLQFKVSDTVGHTIPAGTRAQLALSDGSTMLFALDEALVIAPASNTGTGTATGNSLNDAANGTPVGTILQLVDAVSFVDLVQTITSPIMGGRDPEADSTFLSRGLLRGSRLTEALVLPKHFTAVALENPDVFRATTLNLFDPALGGPAGSNLGAITVVVCGVNGAPLSGGLKTALQAELEAMAIAAVDVYVIDPTITDVDVVVNVLKLPNYSDGQVQANVAALLATYLNPNAWAWSSVVPFYELISQIDRAEGVDRVLTLTTPSADVMLSGNAALAALGTVTVTVTSP